MKSLTCASLAFIWTVLFSSLPFAWADSIDPEILKEADSVGRINFDADQSNLSGIGNTDDLLHEIPEPPTWFSPKDRYEWNKRHYFALAEKRRKRLKAITKYDWSTFNGKTFEDFGQICTNPYTPTRVTTSGMRIKMLAVAYVMMDKSQGASAWGHAAERFVYCKNEVLKDELFEYLPIRDNLVEHIHEDMLRDFKVDISVYPKEYLDSLNHAYYVSYSNDPFSWVYPDLQYKEDRTIYESWFDVDEKRMYQMLLANTNRYKEQSQKIRNQEPLPQYNLFGLNCVSKVKEDIEIVNPGWIKKYHGPMLTPLHILKDASKMNVMRIIVYPSQRLFRKLQMKERGDSTFLEGFAPISKASKGARRGWVMFYSDSESSLKRSILRPVGGVLNFLAGVVETAWGFITIPTNLLSKIPGFEKLYSRERGVHRLSIGLSDMLWSVAEVFGLRVRYPSATDWTEEEKDFIRGLDQSTALLEMLKAKYTAAPIVIEGQPPGQPIANLF